MNSTVLRLVATLALGSQVLPVGLPFLCDQFRPVAQGGCNQQMASRHSGAAVAAAHDATPCASSALCATPLTPALTRSAVIAGLVRTAHVVAFGLVTIESGDPQPPLSPPPQA